MAGVFLIIYGSMLIGLIMLGLERLANLVRTQFGKRKMVRRPPSPIPTPPPAIPDPTPATQDEAGLCCGFIAAFLGWIAGSLATNPMIRQS